MRKIIYTRPDGGLSVVHPVINTKESITKEQALARALEKLPKDALNPQVVDSVPSDRTFRNAWKAGSGCVDHDMGKCRELHRDRLRVARAPKLAALDIQQLRGIDVEAQKQELRDVTSDPRIESAKTPEELKAVWPDCLK